MKNHLPLLVRTHENLFEPWKRAHTPPRIAWDFKSRCWSCWTDQEWPGGSARLLSVVAFFNGLHNISRSLFVATPDPRHPAASLTTRVPLPDKAVVLFSSLASMALKTMYLGMTASARNSLIAMCVLWVLFAIVLVFRVRGRMRGPGLGPDDILSVVALILTTSTIGLNVAVFTTGVGYDFDPTSAAFPKLLNNLPFIMQITFTFTLIYIWALAALKLSQLALYLRVFALELRWHVYIVGAIVIVWALVFNFLFVFLCNPIAQQWTVDRIGHCLDQILVLKMLIITNMVTDLMIVALPVRCVWKLQMRKTEKFAVLACFGLGLACVVISIARFILMYTIDLLSNLTGTSLTTFMLCTVELMLAGLCINIPMLRPFYLRLRAKYKQSSLSNSGRQSAPLSGPGPLRSNEARPGHYTQWLELHDKDQTNVTVTHDDASSERKLTAPHTPSDAIHVSKNWEVTHA